LEATNTDIAIGKYPIGQTPFFQEEDLSFFESSKKWPRPHNHNIATTKSSHRLLQG